jgi:hypothetical protein
MSIVVTVPKKSDSQPSSFIHTPLLFVIVGSSVIVDPVAVIGLGSISVITLTVALLAKGTGGSGPGGNGGGGVTLVIVTGLDVGLEDIKVAVFRLLLYLI